MAQVRYKEVGTRRVLPERMQRNRLTFAERDSPDPMGRR
jgi:hypothetical protein